MDASLLPLRQGLNTYLIFIVDVSILCSWARWVWMLRSSHLTTNESHNTFCTVHVSILCCFGSCGCRCFTPPARPGPQYINNLHCRCSRPALWGQGGVDASLLPLGQERITRNILHCGCFHPVPLLGQVGVDASLLPAVPERTHKVFCTGCFHPVLLLDQVGVDASLLPLGQEFDI